MPLPNSINTRGRTGVLGGVLLLCASLFLPGCDSLVDVENPNNVLDEEIRNASGAPALANGALYTVQDGWDAMLAPYSVVSDELHFVGARGWQVLDWGSPDDPTNEFLDRFFPVLATARWMADETIEILGSLDSAGELTDRTQLARSYLYAALAYVSIADWMDDFAMSDRRDPAPPIGSDNMYTLYDKAIEYLSAGLQIVSSGELARNLLAMRARARHARGVWNMIGRVPINVTNSGLVADAAAVQDALDALTHDGSDWRYQFEYTAATQGSDAAWWINSRRELRFGDDYVIPTANDLMAESIALSDPIDGVPDPRLERFILQEFQTSAQYPKLTVFSAREMHLIIAEDALANDELTTFAAEVNAVRRLDGLTDWTDTSPIAARDMLIHERRVNLLLQGHRLNDMYRFGIKSRYWEATRSAYTTPGTFFTFPISEIETNCHLNPDVECPG
jgi:hypothetical protein